MVILMIMLRKCDFLQFIVYLHIIMGSVWLIRSEITSSKQKRHIGVPRTKCKIPDSDDHYYLKSSCNTQDSRQCQFDVNDVVEGNGTIAVIKCKPGMSMVTLQDFAVCFDGKWYPQDHNCIRLSSTCGLSPPEYKVQSKENETTISAPWYAEVLFYEDKGKSRSNKTICGGTLITPKIVLTAYSCVTEGREERKKNTKHLFVGLGRTSRYERNFDQVIRVRQITGGGRFAALLVSGLTELDKISILKLDSPAEISYDVMPACFDSSILNPHTGYSFLSGVVVGLSDRNVWKEKPQFEEKMESFHVTITDQGSDLSPIFTTQSVDLLRFGSGFIVQVSGRNYIFGVHVADLRAKEGCDFNKVYFNSIGRTIRNYMRENQ